MKLYLHVFDKTTPDTFDTVSYTFANQDGTLEDLFKDVQKVVPQVRPFFPSIDFLIYPGLQVKFHYTKLQVVFTRLSDSLMSI